MPEEPIVEQDDGEQMADRLDALMSALGIVFLLLVIVDIVARPRGTVAAVLGAAMWVIWAAFVAEFVTRLALAPDRGAFLRRRWWQAVFLLLPFLRLVRPLARLRPLVRGGRVLSSAIRGGRSAGTRLSGRVAGLTLLTAITVLAGSLLLYELAPYEHYGDALHDAALATITGEPLGVPGGLAQVLDVVLGAYSVVVFATLAGALGAYFLERK